MHYMDPVEMRDEKLERKVQLAVGGGGEYKLAREFHSGAPVGCGTDSVWKRCERPTPKTTLKAAPADSEIQRQTTLNTPHRSHSQIHRFTDSQIHSNVWVKRKEKVKRHTVLLRLQSHSAKNCMHSRFNGFIFIVTSF